jgi:aspT/yidE/ybjL antiporter duplication domain
MDWIISLLTDPKSAAHLLILYALVISLGVRFGQWKIGGKKNGVAFGVTWVLFVGILVGHICTNYLYENATEAVAYQRHIIDIVKELGLILFVYCIGLQVGPSFFQTFKKGGLGMSLLATLLVLLNVAMTLGLFYLADNTGIFAHPHQKDNLAMMVGVMCGAVTNTPSLGAANSILPELFGDGNAAPAIANGYACAYPLGVVGIILSTIALRFIARISLDKEQEDLRMTNESHPETTPKHLVISVTNLAVEGKTLEELRNFFKRQFVVTRCIYPNGDLQVAHAATQITMGMRLHLVCSEQDAEALVHLLGQVDEEGKAEEVESQQYVSRRMVVTREEVTGRTLAQLHLSSLYGVNVTRITRSGIEFFADRDLPLLVGDRVLVTGTESSVERVKSVLGSQVERLDHPNVGVLFMGILVGLLVGQIPIPFPGVDVPVKLGLAGGPLFVAILVGAFGHRYRINTYVSTSANLMLREVGLILFLSSVGIQAGASFWRTLMAGDGVHYVWMGFLITVVPILICGLIGRWKLKLNYFTLMGLIAGANTDPPALAFANTTAGNNAPAVGYSTVYLPAMFLRILVAQLILLILLG